MLNCYHRALPQRRAVAWWSGVSRNKPAVSIRVAQIPRIQTILFIEHLITILFALTYAEASATGISH
jgi:hypothetical protein